MEKFFFKYILLIFFLFPEFSLASNLNIIGIGAFDFNKQKNEALDFRLEKRIDKSFFNLGPDEEPLYILKPFYGIELTSDSAYYILGGLYVEEKIYKNLYLTPNVGVGGFSEGDGKDLGSNIEFRSTLELSYELDTKKRIGISIGHISNASLGDKNPGTEIISISYQIPY